MKKILMPFLAAAVCLLSLKSFTQGKDDKSKQKQDSIPMLGLAGDNLDLYAVLEIFKKSKTIEEFEKSLNDDKLKINNLDLNLDKKIDFIKVVTKKDGDAFTFILQVDVNKNETQDVAVILLSKDKNKKVSLQIVGDEELYGKDYVIEPKGNSSVTPNPGYTGDDPVTVTVPQSTVVVQSAPIVQYVYSPAYVPYYPPYYYGYYPPWFGFATVMAVGIYRANHWGYHGGYYGGHYHGGNNNVIINTGNRNSINHYNNNRNRSTTVSDNRARGNYGNGAGANNRMNSGPSVSDRAGASNRPSASTRPSTSDRMGGGSGPSVSNRQSPSASTRQSPSASTRQTSSFPSSSSRASSMSGGGRSMGGGYSGGGGFRGGGGGRRR